MVVRLSPSDMYVVVTLGIIVAFVVMVTVYLVKGEIEYQRYRRGR